MRCVFFKAIKNLEKKNFEFNDGMFVCFLWFMLCNRKYVTLKIKHNNVWRKAYEAAARRNIILNEKGENGGPQFSSYINDTCSHKLNDRT